LDFKEKEKESESLAVDNFFIEKNNVCDMDFELRSRSLDKEQINLSEDNRSMYDIFVVNYQWMLELRTVKNQVNGNVILGVD